MSHPINIAGQKFNKLTAIEVYGKNKSSGGILWRCQCECGNYSIVCISKLRNGSSKSCGCLRAERLRKLRTLPVGESAFRGIFQSYRKSARNHDREFRLTSENFRDLIQLPCYYCHAPHSNIATSRSNTGDFIYNGLDRVDSSKGYTLDNVVPCCNKCNIGKSDMTTDEFKLWITDVYNHFVKI